jgi:hypothetical protein
LRRHGQQLHPADAAVITVTASKVNVRFIFSVSSREQLGKYCSGRSVGMSDPRHPEAGCRFGTLRFPQATLRQLRPVFAAKSTFLVLVPGGRAAGHETLHHPRRCANATADFFQHLRRGDVEKVVHFPRIL